jgi:hypothetical protein
VVISGPSTDQLPVYVTYFLTLNVVHTYLIFNNRALCKYFPSKFMNIFLITSCAMINLSLIYFPLFICSITSSLFTAYTLHKAFLLKNMFFFSDMSVSFRSMNNVVFRTNPMVNFVLLTLMFYHVSLYTILSSPPSPPLALPVGGERERASSPPLGMYIPPMVASPGVIFSAFHLFNYL